MSNYLHQLTGDMGAIYAGTLLLLIALILRLHERSR